MQPQFLVLGASCTALLGLTIRSLRQGRWPRPRPWRPEASEVQTAAVILAIELLGMLVALGAGWVTLADIGWKGIPDWPSWALLLALAWATPSLQAWLLAVPSPATSAQARNQLRVAVRMLACDTPRDARAKRLNEWNQRVLNLVHAAFFYGFVVHLAAQLGAGTLGGIAVGFAYLIAWLWFRPAPHKKWLLASYGLNCLVLFLPSGLAGVFVLMALHTLLNPSRQATLQGLKRWRAQIGQPVGAP